MPAKKFRNVKVFLTLTNYVTESFTGAFIRRKAFASDFDNRLRTPSSTYVTLINIGLFDNNTCDKFKCATNVG